MSTVAHRKVRFWVELMKSGKQAFKDGQFDRAEKYFHAAMQEAATLPQKRYALAKTLHWWGVTCSAQGRVEESKFLFRHAYRARLVRPP